MKIIKLIAVWIVSVVVVALTPVFWLFNHEVDVSIRVFGGDEDEEQNHNS